MISIVIPNWNGRKLLEKNLPAVLAAKPDEIIIVDDASLDDSTSFLKKKYPEIKIIRNEKNIGFAKSCNKGVAAAKGDIVVLLNNDVIPEPNFLSESTKHFADQEVFAVSFNEPSWSWARIYWKNGFIEHEPGPKTDKTHISAWASGGSGVFRKTIWNKLGGFDDLYYPFYWEDVDLGYRAWKRGYKILWEPKAIVHHEHEGTIGKNFSKSYIDYISSRNQLIFIWKNISEESLLRQHFRSVIENIIYFKNLKSFLSAFFKLPMIIARRKQQNNFQNSITDSVILKYFQE
jgi:GT2 family glycosyltransferase